MRRRDFLLLSLLPFTAELGGCSGEPETGPVEVKWDRDACERCRMVLSDRKHAAEVRHFTDGKRSKLYRFDDIGCAVIWLEDKPWRDDPKTEIWVAERNGAGWLNARKAFYVTGDSTPMEYGVGAQSVNSGGAMDFTALRGYILEREQRFNQHGDDLLKRVQQRSARRADHQHNHNAMDMKEQ